MTALREALEHPLNAGRPVATVGRWVAHNIRRRLARGMVVTVDLGNHRITGPANHPVICLSVYIPGGRHDWDAFAQLEAILTHGDVFVDVGANLGAYTMQASQLVGSTGEIIAIEPDPDQLRFLQINVQGLEAPVTIVQAAVADSPRGMALERPGPTLGYLVPVEAEEGSLTTTTLDSIAKARGLLGRADRCVIKIDIEGWEPSAIVGATALLDSGVKALLVEARGHQHRSNVPWEVAVHALRSRGFRFTWTEQATGKVHLFDDPPPVSPFGDYLVLSAAEFERSAQQRSI